MKRYLIIALCFAAIAALATACGNRSKKAEAAEDEATAASRKGRKSKTGFTQNGTESIRTPGRTGIRHRHQHGYDEGKTLQQDSEAPRQLREARHVRLL